MVVGMVATVAVVVLVTTWRWWLRIAMMVMVAAHGGDGNYSVLE